MRNAMKANETKFILLHCPRDLVREVDDLCEMNFLNRTEFMLFAIDSMMEFFERRQQMENVRSGIGDEEDCPIPGDGMPDAFFSGDEEELVLWAAEEQEDFSADFSWKPDGAADNSKQSEGGGWESEYEGEADGEREYGERGMLDSEPVDDSPENAGDDSPDNEEKDER